MGERVSGAFLMDSKRKVKSKIWGPEQGLVREGVLGTRW